MQEFSAVTASTANQSDMLIGGSIARMLSVRAYAEAQSGQRGVR